jgi:hypothetical protein
MGTTFRVVLYAAERGGRRRPPPPPGSPASPPSTPIMSDYKKRQRAEQAVPPRSRPRTCPPVAVSDDLFAVL